MPSPQPTLTVHHVGGLRGVAIWVATGAWLVWILPIDGSWMRKVATVAVGLAVMCVAVLAHELGHAAVMRISGRRVEVRVSPLFGYALSDPEDDDAPPLTPNVDLGMLSAGPAVNALLGVALYVVQRSGASIGWPSIVQQVVAWGSVVNLAMAAFNMLPVHPLDGAKVLSNVVGRVRSPRLRCSADLALASCATTIAAAGVLRIVTATSSRFDVFGLIVWLVLGSTSVAMLTGSVFASQRRCDPNLFATLGAAALGFGVGWRLVDLADGLLW